MAGGLSKMMRIKQILLIFYMFVVTSLLPIENAYSEGSGKCWVEGVDCIEESDRTIKGQKRECWRRKKMYKCEGYADKEKSCDKLSQNNNCIIEEEPECKEKHNGWCVNEEIKYGCSKESKIKRIEKRIRVPTFKKEDNEEMRRRVK